MLHLVPTLIATTLAAPAPAQGDPARDLLVLRLEDTRQLLRHPKDQGLLRIAGLLDDRLAELPQELNGGRGGAPNIPPAWIQLATELLTSAKTMRMGLRPGMPLDGPAPPFYGRLELHRASAEEAGALEVRVLDVLRQMGAPELGVAPNGLRLIPETPMPVYFGASGRNVVLDLDAPPTAPFVSGDPLLPQGAAPLFGMALDYGPLMQVVLGGMAQGDPAAAQMVGRIFERFGLDRLKIQLASATDSERSYSVMRIPGYAAILRANGLAASGDLAPAELALVPRDATWVSVSKVNFAGLLDVVLGIAGEAMQAQGMEGDPVEMLAGVSGFHLRDDFFGLLGETFGLYASDTTGGGGLMSTVMFVALRDAEGALETRERLEEMLNGLAALQMQGYMQVRSSDVDGVEYATMTFPGLPVPLEPTVAITDGWLFVGASPGAAIEAVRQARTAGAPNVLDHPALQAQLPGGIAGLQSLSFQDGERLVRDGYGTMRMLASALANGVRSRTDGLRDAGEVLPPFHVLVADVQSTVSVGRLMGDDWVMESRGDASVAVQLTAMCGWLQSSGLMLVPMLAAVGAAQQQGGMVQRGF